MSFYYSESNDEPTIELYRKRFIYRGDIISYANQYGNLTDFNRGEKFFYGRVNRLFIPITYNKVIPLKKFISTTSPEFEAASFVVDAFEAMAKQFEKCSLTRKISPNDPFLSGLRVFKAHQDPDRLYSKHLDSRFAAIADDFLANNIKVRNFDEFMRELSKSLIKSSHTHPFTQTAFMKSKKCPIFSTGLALEIADLDPTNDDAKIEQFIKSPNWEFYLNTCRSYGFMVDRMVPWRLVADIAASPILEYARQYGVGSTNAILIEGYGKTHLKYYAKFKFWLLQLYNQVKLPVFTVLEDCRGASISRAVTPKDYTPRSLLGKYAEAYFLEAYCRIRFLEEETKFEIFERDIVIDDTIELYQAKSVQVALDKFEKILNKPFDYRGSMSYTKRQFHARKNAEEP